MIINVKVKPSSGKQEVESFGNDRYLVYLKEPPENNRANMELINILAKYMTVPPTRIHIIRGLSDNNKVIEIR